MSFSLPIVYNIPGNVIVASAVLILRTVFDCALLTKSFNMTIKKIHIDLLWMGLVVWGIFLFDLTTKNMLFDLVGNQPYSRLFIFCILLVCLVGATKLKKFELDISLKQKTWREHAQIIGITLFLHLMAFINLGASLVLGQTLNHP